jgi:KUP system potassium uptake protein
MEYKVHEMSNDKIIHVDLRLGFRIDPRVNVMFRQIVQELVLNHEVDINSRYYSLHKNNVIGDFRFVVIEKHISNENELGGAEKIILNMYDLLKHFSMSEGKEFGLDTSSVTVEKVPIVLRPIDRLNLKRVE